MPHWTWLATAFPVSQPTGPVPPAEQWLQVNACALLRPQGGTPQRAGELTPRLTPGADVIAAPVTVVVGLVAARFTGSRVDALRWLVLFLLCSLVDFLYFRVMPLYGPGICFSLSPPSVHVCKRSQAKRTV